MSNNFEREIEIATQLARAASRVILEHYSAGFSVESKGEEGPVTQADRDANEVIVSGLREHFPEDAILAEESRPDSSRFSHRRLWCVDPLDGTREFIDKNGMFVVMIGLAVDGEARCGVVYQPTEDLLLWGAGNRAGAVQGGKPVALNLSTCVNPAEAVMVVSRSHRSKTVTSVAEQLGVTQEQPVGSVGLKVAYIAQGKAEIYISTTNRMREWDTCAPEAILRAVGGQMTDIRGEPLRYNKEDSRVLYGVIATNGMLQTSCVQALLPVCRERGWT